MNGVKNTRTTARVVVEAPLSDGSTAGEIMGFVVRAGRLLDSRFRICSLIPDDVWAPGTPDAGTVLQKVRGLIYARRNGVTPELIILAGTGVYRYAPWTRDTNGGLEELLIWEGTTGTTVPVPSVVSTPPVFATVGNRIIFAWGDGRRPLVIDMDTWMIRPFGAVSIPGAPTARGPTRDGTSANGGGWTAAGRIGTTDGSWTDPATLATVGGLDAGSWQYARVFEYASGAYSPMSPLGNPVGLERVTADPSATPPVYMENLTRRFQFSLSPGDEYVVAQVILRTPNLMRLPPGDTGEPRFLARISNNRAEIYNDDHPDGELGGAPWPDRAIIPGCRALVMHSGSLFVACNDRIYWSEQTSALGPQPESFLAGHWLSAGDPVTAVFGCRPAGNWGDKPPLLVFTATKSYVLTGDYPQFNLRLLSDGAGCAGPCLIQSAPNGSVIWYGNGSFWQLGEGGQVKDIGDSIRDREGRVSAGLAGRCGSLVVPETREVIFFLATDGNNQPDTQYIWDAEAEGWRFRQDIQVTGSVVLPDHGIVLMAGTPPGGTSSNSRVWVMDRENPISPGAYTHTWTYRTGWTAPEGASSTFGAHAAKDLVLACEERGIDTATASSYGDWSLDDLITEPQTIHASTSDGIGGDIAKPLAVWGPVATDYQATWGASWWRTPRPYTQRVPLDGASNQVTAVEITGTGDFALHLLDVWSVAQTRGGKRVDDTVRGR